MSQLKFTAIDCSGKDAQTFLQSQLTCDMQSITESPSFGAYCDSKGRILANFYIQKYNNIFRIWLPEAITTTFLETIKKYAIFSKVSFKINLEEMPTFKTSAEYFIDQGIAWITQVTSLLFIPQMINWEKLGGVSFTKGCFLGQEIVARTQHLGKLKRHLYHVKIETTDNIHLNQGTKLLNNDSTTIGILCSFIRDNKNIYGLAVMQDKNIEKTIFIEKQPINIDFKKASLPSGMLS